MKRISLLLPLVAFAAILPATLTAQVTISSHDGWSIRGTDPVKIFFEDEHVTSYHAGIEAGKPYFYPVIGPTGENMTRHWPMDDSFDDEEQDHPHHRGVWYGLGRVNGFDFWHQAGDRGDRKFGMIRHKAMDGVQMSDEDLTIRMKSEWLEHGKPSNRIMSDRREFRLFYTKGGALVLDAAITLIADAGDVLIEDDKEGAWSVRAIPTLRLEGEHAKGDILNSEGIQGKSAWGKRAKWVDYFGVDRAGNEVGIAVFDHPSNLRHPTWWHARHYGLLTANPFGQGHFEEDVDETAGNYTIPNGESVTFRYRTIFHEGDPEAAGVAQAYEEFAE